MPLSCSCDYDYYDDCDWYYESPDDYHPLYRRRAVRCASCRSLIRPGETATLFRRWRSPRSDIECRIYGDDGEIPLAPMFHCETCADLFFSLRELGYECIAPNEGVRQLVKEYAELQGRPPMAGP